MTKVDNYYLFARNTLRLLNYKPKVNKIVHYKNKYFCISSCLRQFSVVKNTMLI